MTDVFELQLQNGMQEIHCICVPWYTAITQHAMQRYSSLYAASTIATRHQ